MNPETQSSPNPTPAPPHGEVSWEYFVDGQKAADFGVDRVIVEGWAEEGRIPSHSMNDGDRQGWRFLVSELKVWLEHAIEAAQPFGTHDGDASLNR